MGAEKSVVKVNEVGKFSSREGKGAEGLSSRGISKIWAVGKKKKV